MKSTVRLIIASALSSLFLGAFGSAPPFAEQSEADMKSAAPAPRAMITDRPSKTAGPFTLDAGRAQFEVEFITRAHDSDDGVNTSAWSLGSTYVRWGATPQCELQLGCQSYAKVTVEDTGGQSRASGFGDTVARAKFNLWCKDGGDTAFGLLLFVKIPTNQGGLGNRAFEPGCSLPFVANLPLGWQLGLMTKWSRLLNASASGRHNFFEYYAIACHSLPTKFSAYGELWTGRSTETGADQQSSAGFGLGYTLSDNSILDASVNLALNQATTDLVYCLGFSVRL